MNIFLGVEELLHELLKLIHIEDEGGTIPMAYQAKTWVGRELIRATALNHIEDGIETNSEKIEALEESSVSYKEQQVLTEQEKLLARENIGAAGAGEAGIAQNGVAAGGTSGQMLVKTSLVFLK